MNFQFVMHAISFVNVVFNTQLQILTARISNLPGSI